MEIVECRGELNPWAAKRVDLHRVRAYSIGDQGPVRGSPLKGNCGRRQDVYSTAAGCNRVAQREVVSRG